MHFSHMGRPVAVYAVPQLTSDHMVPAAKPHQQGDTLLPAATYDAKLRKCQFVWRDAYRGELCIAPLCAFAVRADEKVSDCLFRVVAHQLRAEPSHSDAAIRTVRGIELPQCFL